MQLDDHKQRAAELGIPWATVRDAYDAARSLEREELDRRAEFRRGALRAQSGHEHAGRWRFANRAAFAGGDATYIRGLDVSAADRGMAADELFDELAADVEGLRPADDVMAETIEQLAADRPAAETTWVPVPAAAAAADITEQWLRQLIKAGRVRGRREGRRWFAAAADVEWFARHPTAGRPRLRAHLAAAPF
jgi:hypothetical protein